MVPGDSDETISWLRAAARAMRTYTVDHKMLERFAERAKKLMYGIPKRFGHDADVRDFVLGFLAELGVGEPRDPNDGSLIENPPNETQTDKIPQHSNPTPTSESERPYKKLSPEDQEVVFREVRECLKADAAVREFYSMKNKAKVQ